MSNPPSLDQYLLWDMDGTIGRPIPMPWDMVVATGLVGMLAFAFEVFGHDWFWLPSIWILWGVLMVGVFRFGIGVIVLDRRENRMRRHVDRNVSPSLRIKAAEIYGPDKADIAAWECTECCMPGDCPLCGAD